MLVKILWGRAVRGPVEYATPEGWSVTKAAAAAVSATVDTLEQVSMDSKCRSATVEVCDENGVAYYVIDIKKVRETPKQDKH
jgi:hypothetical protein